MPESTLLHLLALVLALPPAVGAAQDPQGKPYPTTAASSQQSEPGETGENAQPDLQEQSRLETLDEAKPFEWSWDSFLGLLTGQEAFTVKQWKLEFRLGSALQIDGTNGTEDSLLEQAYGPIDSGVDLRRLRLSGHGRVNDMIFMVCAELGVDACPWYFGVE